VTQGGLHLLLFVAANSPDSAMAIANLTALFPDDQRSGVRIEIIDVERDPARANREGIMVTPTLIKVFPRPTCRILGNLKNGDALLQLLAVSRSGS
jgi:circadian clock protein KaiB